MKTSPTHRVKNRKAEPELPYLGTPDIPRLHLHLPDLAGYCEERLPPSSSLSLGKRSCGNALEAKDTVTAYSVVDLLGRSMLLTIYKRHPFPATYTILSTLSASKLPAVL